MILKGIFISWIFVLMISCNVDSNENEELPVTELSEEIKSIRTKFWSLAMIGKLDSMLSYHFSGPEYRLYENGKFYDYNAQADGHKNMNTEGISSIKFDVQVKDPVILNREYAFETWDGTTVTTYNSGKIDTSDRFFVTILYQKIKDQWKFRYLHSSSQIAQNK
jgi:hypothetical protein